MTISIRRLGPGDESVLELLAREDADFDLDDEGHPREALTPAAAAAYLADPAVLHWIAVRDGTLAGHLSSHILRMRSGAPEELLLYEIGVRASCRRQGVGRALVEAMTGWMAARGIATVWVLADNPGAADFYRACGFSIPAEMATFMLRA